MQKKIEKIRQKFNKECTCPLCGSHEVTFDGFEQDVETGWYRCICDKCDTTWNEVVSMKFMFVDDIIDKDGHNVEANQTRQDIIYDNEVEEAFDNYSEDYFDDNDKELIKLCVKLFNMVKTATFEWDTFETDDTLHLIKECIDRVDI